MGVGRTLDPSVDVVAIVDRRLDTGKEVGLYRCGVVLGLSLGLLGFVLPFALASALGF